MKRIVFFSSLLFVLMFSLFSSCKKDEEEEGAYEYPIEIRNYSENVIYFCIGTWGETGTNITAIAPNQTWKSTYKIDDKGSCKTFDIVDESSGRRINTGLICWGDSLNFVYDPLNSESEQSGIRDEWDFNFELTNWSSGPVYVYIDGVKSKTVEVETRLTFTHTVVNQSSVNIEVKTAEGLILDSKSITKGGYYQNTVKDLPAHLDFYNSTSDNYMIYVDGEYFCTVAPGKYSQSIEIDLGSHKLLAIQKDGYILWATEETTTYNFTRSWITYGGVVYTWDFHNNKIETAVG